MLGLIGVSVWVMSPFIPSLIWAITIVIATWPLMRKLQSHLANSRGWAVTGMTLALLLLFFGPLTLAAVTIVENADRISGWIKAAADLPKTAPPQWVAQAPLVGERAASYWRELGDTGFGQLLSKAMPYAGVIAAQVLKQAGLIATITMQFLLTVTLCALLYMGGEDIGMRTLAFFRRLAGVRGERTARLAAASVRGVALGVVVTALVQALLGGIGLALAGVPAWSLLTAVMLLLAIAQIGVVPVMVPAAIWLFWADHTLLGIAMVIWTLFVGTLDNFLRPWLIRQGAKLPLSLIFAGVVGGMMAFGMIGMFIGPVVLAVTYTLLDAWIDDVEIDTGEEEAVS
jgi:predicted PurR-regulated permease PerM